MEPLVVDSNIIVASFLENEQHHDQAQEYIDGLERGDYIFHLPTLANVEVTSAIRRRAEHNWMALIAAWMQNVADWEQAGTLILYPLDRNRMDHALDIALRYRLKGSDCVFAGLAEELGIPIKTFDQEVLDRFPLANLT